MLPRLPGNDSGKRKVGRSPILVSDIWLQLEPDVLRGPPAPVVPSVSYVAEHAFMSGYRTVTT